MEDQIRQWRLAILDNHAVSEADVDELETHLREQISGLTAVGLAEAEAFTVAAGRLGTLDHITAEFAREHGDRLWKQLTMTSPETDFRRSLAVMLGFAALAVVIVQTARFFSDSTHDDSWVFRNFSFLLLSALIGYFAVRRRVSRSIVVVLTVSVLVLAVVVNLFPFSEASGGVEIFGDGVGSVTGLLVAIHLPVVLWCVVGFAYVSGEVSSSARRMDFIRFTGEWTLYYVLIALGGLVLMGLTMVVLAPITPEELLEQVFLWVLPSGVAAAVIVAAWLVEAKKSIVENLAPVLTTIFTPLFAVMLSAAVVGYAIAGIGRDFDRNLLMGFDLLLLVVLALVVYGISSRQSIASVGITDVVRLVAVIAAVMLDLLVLVSMVARVGEFGFTANRAVALGLNLVLLLNLLVTVWHMLRFVQGRAQIARLERWQTDYLAVFAAWALGVVLVLPPLFGFA